MRLISSVALLLACGLAAGCSKSVRPDVGPTGSSSDLAATGTYFPQLQFAGDVVVLDASLEPRVLRHHLFYVTTGPQGGGSRDTVPAYSVLENVRWIRADGSPIDASGSPSMVVPTSERQTFAPGTHEIVLEAPHRAGGGEVKVRFWAGFPPDTWWAGPDPSRWPIDSEGSRSVAVTDWTHFTTVPPWPPDGRAYFGPDSFSTIPSQRRPVGGDFESRTFYEIHGDRIYARREGDTVHFDSWLVFVNGGYDRDSPYRPIVDPLDPALPPGFGADPLSYPVLHDLGLVGSPIGFRSQMVIRLPSGPLAIRAQSIMYPNFDPNSVFRFPQNAGYVRAGSEGRAYVVARAQDSDGIRDPSVTDAVGIADRVDAGGGTPEERRLRRKILTFFVGPAPAATLARVSWRARGS